MQPIQKMQTTEKAIYSKPSLTVHGTVEALTQTYRCSRHNRYNCSDCSHPDPDPSS